MDGTVLDPNTNKTHHEKNFTKGVFWVDHSLNNFSLWGQDGKN